MKERCISVIDQKGVHLRRASIFLPVIDGFLVVGGVRSFAGGGDSFPGTMRGIKPHLTEKGRGWRKEGEYVNDGVDMVSRYGMC